MRLVASINGRDYDLELQASDSGWRCSVNGRDIPVDVAVIAPDRLSLLLKGKSYDVARGPGDTLRISENNYEVSVADPRSWRSRRRAGSGTAGQQKLTASMPGRVVRVLVEKGATIDAGQGVIVVEAMKMQNEIRSPRPGRISAILVQQGANVNAGQVLAIVE